MGKLHSLKKAILKDPSKWYGAGAKKSCGEWEPIKDWWRDGHNSYKNFVKKILTSGSSSIGNAFDMGK